MRKTVAAVIITLLITAAAGTLFVRLGNANPYLYHEHVLPPAGSIPLAISILSPNNNAIFNVSAVTLAFDLKTEGTNLHTIYSVYFEASWLQENVAVYKQNTYSPEFPSFWSYNETFRNLSDGNYSIVITAHGGGGYAEGLTAYSFDMTTTSVINFTISPPPRVSILSPLNETYNSSEIALNFAVNKSFSKISFVLDDKNNVTINENATLNGLTNGIHNVTVYVCDAMGNIGPSETVTFTVDVPEPFPAAFVSAISAASVATVGTSLLLYRKKRIRKVEQV